MAWVAVNHNPYFEYDNAPPDPGADSPLRPLWLKQTAGIRTVGSGAGSYEIYASVRRVGETTPCGELNKTYWDSRDSDWYL